MRPRWVGRLLFVNTVTCSHGKPVDGDREERQGRKAGKRGKASKAGKKKLTVLNNWRRGDSSLIHTLQDQST